MVVHNIQTGDEFNKHIRNRDDSTLSVLDCYAPWCGPCKVIAPIIVKFSEAYPAVEFYKLDVDGTDEPEPEDPKKQKELPEIARELGIRAMPTFLLFKGGKRVGEIVGANAKAVESAIKSNLSE